MGYGAPLNTLSFSKGIHTTTFQYKALSGGMVRKVVRSERFSVATVLGRRRVIVANYNKVDLKFRSAGWTQEQRMDRQASVIDRYNKSWVCLKSFRMSHASGHI